ncbi:NAD-binding protein [Caballeronia sp. BR00000012568055]|uniref:NAD-binding protein n=1 Tax=Caballeronia sp. BR00000012568055 TaxID=2918761 RepID=UPI0023F6A0F6|nr:NAD-binding protein [Caballeronia sp. BR00000012568055]
MTEPTAPANHVISEPIGFIGLGAMGAPMARHLATLGYSLLVYDTNASAVASAVERGAQSMTSAKAIADRAAIVLTCLPSLPAIKEVVFGEEGVSKGGAARILVDFSTTGARFAQDLAADLKSFEIDLLDSPITGNVSTAGNGKLGIMCSGPERAFERVAPIMRDLASLEVLYLGEETGKAQTLKLLNNSLSATGMASACEAFILGVKGGLNPQRMLEIINSGDASSSATRNKFGRSVLPRKFDFGARMAITAKDISLTVEEAQNRGVPMWVAQTVQQLWKYAAMQGGADRDGTSLITYLEPWSGVEVASRGEAISCERAVSVGATFVPHILICDESEAEPISLRLREQGFKVEIPHGEAGAAQPTTVPARSFGTCVLIGVKESDEQSLLVKRIRQAAGEGGVVINTRTMSIAESTRFHQQTRELGLKCVDGLHTGPSHERRSGQGVIIVGGAAAAIDAVVPLLAALSRRVFVISERPGDAQLMHMIHASLFATLLVVTSEAFVAGAKAGLTPLQMKTIMGIETGRNAASARILPEQVATRRFDYGLTLAQARRHLTMATDAARQLGVTTWIFDKVLGVYGLVCSGGHSPEDVSSIAKQYESWAQVKVETVDRAQQAA